MNAALVKIDKLSVTISGKEILKDISLEIGKGETWVIFGKAGSGKTILAETLEGRHFFRGDIIFKTQKQLNHQAVIAVYQQHRFRNLSNQSDFYYQQRFNSFDASDTITVGDQLAVFSDSRERIFSVSEMIRIFGLEFLINEPLIQLSNGENKRLQLLKAVLGNHDLLILDEPYTGLDSEGRNLLDGVLKKLAEAGQSMLLLSSRNHLPASFSNVAFLRDGVLVMQNQHNEEQETNAQNSFSLKKFPSDSGFTFPDFEHAVSMRDVHIIYEGKTILDHINWEVKKGACWGLTGHNGAGKSTLLSLITGDNPQAYSNDIYLFDRKRGTGESIWDIKQKIGFLSPELQLYFDPAATVYTTLASGLFDTIGLFRQLSHAQHHHVTEWLDFLNLAGRGNMLLTAMPAGIQRLVLLGRAMIKTPPLLILDEPCQGLDMDLSQHVTDLIDYYCKEFRAGLIFVSHYQHDFPHCIDKWLTLSQGKVIND